VNRFIIIHPANIKRFALFVGIMEPSENYPSMRKDSDGQREEINVDYPSTMDSRSTR
jgi:hypothetical protein